MVSSATLQLGAGQLEEASSATGVSADQNAARRGEPAAPRPSERAVESSERPEVRISPEARARREAQLAARGRSPGQQVHAPARAAARERLAESRPRPPENSAAEIELRAQARRTIAVRVGPAPAPELIDLEELQLRALNERAALRQVASVVLPQDSQPSADRAQPAAPPLPGQGRAATGELQLPGSGKTGRPTTLPPRDAPRLVSTATARQARAHQPGPVQNAPAPREIERLERQAIELPLANEDLQTTSAVAPHAAPLMGAERAPGAETPGAGGSDAREPAQAIAQQTLTHAGVVEAQAEDELVTRYFERSRPQDPGPEPRVPGELRRNTP
jgi:hypothetical protein